MQSTQQISRVRRDYNIWVGNQTLEDYALRFTAKKARRGTIAQVGQTALGATAFLALEALAATITLSYGFSNALLAMLTVAIVSFVIGFPISYYAARYGLDIDLLTRGAGFGYMGSTITSLIYAAFTFIFFAIEATILASALEALFGIPPAIGYILCAVAVIPIVTHGITTISKFQMGTQPFWLALQCLALAVVIWHEFSQFEGWIHYEVSGEVNGTSTEGGFNLLYFGASAAILFAIVAQIGEQVDYLRFMPGKTPQNRRRWWFWLVLAGPGWILIGFIKMLLGSFLAYLALSRGAPMEQAIDPTYMYQTVFNYLSSSPTISLILAAVMVIISQMKINVTNAYAGSIAWSNFFSRLTHSHPGRVVWLVFNMVIALILMELGIYKALEAILSIFSIVAVSWLASLAADLTINKPLGLSPPFIEFKRAHLYDINPVGVGSLLLASSAGLLCYLGLFGETVKSLAHFISLLCCYVSVPLIAWFTRGRFYLARQSPELLELMDVTPLSGQHKADHTLLCCLCDTEFEHEDMSYCSTYEGPICSLCCSLDSRCMDSCKSNSRFSEQITALLQPLLPELAFKIINSWMAKYLGILSIFGIVLAMLLGLIYVQMQPDTVAEVTLLKQTMITMYFILLIITGVIAWLFLLAHESRVVAQQESSRQTTRLIKEIDAHKITDQALQQAKDHAEQANNAKSRFLTGISHELRTPLQSILGYAQLLSQHQDIPGRHHNALQIIKRSGDYLTDLIEGLLDISKIEAGRLDIYRNQVKLPDLIEQLVYMFRDQAARKGITFSCHIHGRLPDIVIADEKRLRQILINLLSNAIKYTKEGSVDFDVHYRNQVAVFSVTDTGIGIHQEDMDRILHPFERVRNPSVPNVSGTGLGLTIVNLLTEIMGGELKIESTPDTGSCFTVSIMLPWVTQDEEEVLPDKQISGYLGTARTAMVVDDEPLHRGLMTDLLSPLGFTVVEAYDAGNCLEILQDLNPDIFLLDVSMPPGISGLALAEQLRQQGYRQPIVMISADAKEHHPNEGELTYHNGYIVKPVNNQKLLEKIGSLLQLEWQYVEEHSEPERQTWEAPANHALPTIPDHPLSRELLAYAHIGYQSGVVSKLTEIEEAALLPDGTIRCLRHLSQNMQFNLIVDMIESQVS